MRFLTYTAPIQDLVRFAPLNVNVNVNAPDSNNTPPKISDCVRPGVAEPDCEPVEG